MRACVRACVCVCVCAGACWCVCVSACLSVSLHLRVSELLCVVFCTWVIWITAAGSMLASNDSVRRRREYEEPGAPAERRGRGQGEHVTGGGQRSGEGEHVREEGLSVVVCVFTGAARIP